MSDVMLGSAGPMEPALDTFRHEALLYAGIDAFLEGTVPFIEAGLSSGEPVLAVVSAGKIERLRDALGRDADRVVFSDMAAVGRNPARIIPVWREFRAEHGAGRPARGIGEPVYPERTPEELVECQRHEALLNLAFAAGGSWRLRCPYDVSSLRPEVVASASDSHRFITDGRQVEESPRYRAGTWSNPLDGDLPEPPGSPPVLQFRVGSLEPVRDFVTHYAAGAIGAPELSDLLLAITEVTANSLIHGGGHGALRVWNTGTTVVCEVRDQGWIRQPLVGRTRPRLDQENGRGLWMVNQLCDLVQLRSSRAGTVVRMRMHRRTPV